MMATMTGIPIIVPISVMSRMVTDVCNIYDGHNICGVMMATVSVMPTMAMMSGISMVATISNIHNGHDGLDIYDGHDGWGYPWWSR
jgi:hypothetical protein